MNRQRNFLDAISSHSRSRRFSRSCSRSPSPRYQRGKGGESPRRYHSRTPPRNRIRRYSRSPRRRISRSRSPRRRFSRSRSRSMKRRTSRSHSRFRSRSPPRFRSRSPKFRSKSPRFRGRSPTEYQERIHSRSHSKSRNYSNSPISSGRTSEGRRSKTPVITESATPDIRSESTDRSQIVTLEDVDDGPSASPQPECISLEESGDEHRSNSDEEIEVLSCTTSETGKSSSLKSNQGLHPKRHGPSITELTDRIAYDFMKPETQALLQNILKLSTEERSSPKVNREDSPSPDPIITEKILEEMALDLEEVGEEVDDYFVKAEAESLREDNERKAAVNPSPPKVKNIMSYSNTQTDHPPDMDYHSDWDLKFALENPEKPLEKAENISFRPPPVDKNRGNKLNSSSLWTPALDRRQVTESKRKMSYQAGKSNWEVETPYVARNTKKAAFQKEGPLAAQTLESSRCVASAKPEPVTTHGPALAHVDLKRSKTASTSQQPSPMRPLLPSGPNCNIQGPPPTQMQEQIKSHVSGIQNYDIKGLIPENPKNMEAFAKNIVAALHSKLSGGFQGEMHDLQNISTKTNEADFRASAVKSGNIHKSSQLPSSSKKSKNYYKPVDSASKKESTPELDGSHGAIGETSKDKDVIESDGKSSLEEMENLIQNKTKLLKQIQLLESQRSVLQDQKNNIVRNHKGDSKSLDELLEENSFLHEEVGKQITKRSDMVHKLNVTLVRVMKNRKGHEAAESQSKSPEHNQRRGRSPEPDQRYAKSAENRQRGSDSPERSHRYRTSPKHSREFSRSPEHSRRNQRSPPPYPQRHQRSPKNFTRHARSPRRSSGRSKSPESNQKRSLSPEPSRMKRPRSPVPVSVKVQEKHWSRSHIMGTLKKFKKDLLSEVDLPRPSNVKRLPQDNDPDVDDRIREGSQSQNIKRQTEKEYTTQNLKTLRSDENTINYSKFDSRESEKHNRQWQSESKKSLSSVMPEADTDRVGLKELQARMRLSSIMDPKTLFRFMDLGMHWCKLCDMVFETIPMYCSHLLAASHLSKLKNDTRPWLSKAPKEDKKPVAPDANILHIPILGSEFYHSLPVIYCSLCNVFLRDVGEAVKHPESDKHTGNFKRYKDSHPDKVESYRKSHNAALSRHKLSEQKKLIKSETGDESSLQIEDKLLREIKSKRERIMKQKSEIERDKDKDLKARSHGSGSVRVASREQRPTVSKEDPSSVSASHEGSSGKGSNSPKESDSVPTDKEDNKLEIKKSEKDKVDDEEDVKEKILEQKNEDPGGKFRQLSQDKPAKENSMGIRFPLFGKMPSFRKKASFTNQPKTSGNPIPKDSISSNCKNSNINETSDIKLSDKKEVLQLDCNIPGKKEALQLGCKIPGKKEDLMLGCKLPDEEEGLQLDCKLPDKKESSQLEGKLPEKKETFQIKGRLPDKETFQIKGRLPDKETFQIKGRLPDKETFQLECKMTEKKETFKLECNLPEKKDEKAIEIDNVSIKVDSQTNLKIDTKSIQEDKFDEQGGLCDSLGETRSSMGEIKSSLVMVEGKFVKETKLQEKVNTVQCISTPKEGNQELSTNNVLQLMTNTIEMGEEIKMHIDESAPQTEKEKVYDCVEIANVEAKPVEGEEEEESTDDVSSATMEALELLNIPLPGFNSAKKNILVSNVISSEPTGMVDVQEVMEIPLPPRDSPIKTVEMQDINPFCHGVQMDEQISAYGTKCQNLITVGSGYVDISFSSQESGIDSPCSEREHTPPPPGTETVERGSELSKETVHFVDKGRATPPPPGTEPVPEEQVMDMDEIYSVKVDSVQKPKEDTDDSDLKCEDVVEPNKCGDGRRGGGGGEEFEMEANLLAQATLCSDGEMSPDVSEIVQLSQEISGDLDAKRNETNVIGEMFLELDENFECLDDNLKFEELCTGVSESLEEVINVNEQIDFALIEGEEEPRNGNVDMASSFESVECNKEAAESSLEVGDKDNEKEECDIGAAESSLEVDDRNNKREENIHYKKCVVILDDIIKKGDEKSYRRDCIHKEGDDGEINDDDVAEKGENANMDIVEKGGSTIEEEENDGIVKSIQEENSPIRKGEMITSDCGEKVSLPDTEAMESSKKSEEVEELSSTPRRTTRATKSVICEEKETNKIQVKPKSTKGKTLPSKQQKVGVSGTEEEETLDSEAAIRKPVLSAKKVLEINQQVDCVEESAQQVTSVDIIEKEQICHAEPFSSRRSTRGLGALHVEMPKEGDSKTSPKKEPLPCRRSSRTTRSSAIGGKEEKPQISNAVEIVPEEDDVGEREEVSSSQEKEEEEQCSSISSSNVQESTKETLSEKTTARSSRSNQKTTAAEPLLLGRSSRRAAVAASKAMAAQLKDQHKPLSSPPSPECDS